ncbi:MAG: hypothetical protein LBS08_03200 [Candidatus Symbiothrix sp.]|jgi:hypothetical protein|nr:hypothetical protein [Candidatus Symbiothrix sp.]
MKKRALFLVGLAILVAGCDVVQTRKFRSYITGYYNYAGIALKISGSGNIALEGSGRVWLCGWDSKGKEKVIYDSLCVLHNDMSYNKKRDYIAVPDWGFSFKGDIVSIDVVSNADFDAQHPANSSLNDIIRFLSVSLYPYIISGYKNTFDWERDLPESFQCEKSLRQQVNQNEASCYHPIDKKLSELTSEDLILVDWNSFLVFEQQPDLSKEHELKVTVKMSDGRTFTPSIKKIFES